MIFVTRATRMLHSKANGDETENAGTNEKREKGKKKKKKGKTFSRQAPCLQIQKAFSKKRVYAG